jgi:hypothetical protein
MIDETQSEEANGTAEVVTGIATGCIRSPMSQASPQTTEMDHHSGGATCAFVFLVRSRQGRFDEKSSFR